MSDSTVRPVDFFARKLATVMLSGEFTETELLSRSLVAVKDNRKWLTRQVARVIARFGNQRPRRRHLVRFLCQDRFFQRAVAKEGFEVEVNWEIHKFLPSGGLQNLSSVMPWNTVRDLSDWLGLREEELAWFADRRQLLRNVVEEPLRHYRCHWIRKPGGRCRLIEVPKPRLREIQRRLLRNVFEQMPVHDAAHGFRKGRSTATHTALHAGKAMVLRMDLLDFFPSISPSRLTRLLMLAGYAESVAELLTHLCTNFTPRDVWRDWPYPDDRTQQRQTKRLYQRPHFPQGSPTSPAIANLCMYRLDRRLAALADSAGAAFTRYADDLLFSGGDNFRRRIDHFRILVAGIALEEGLRINHHKTKVMPRSTSQQAVGLILNEKPQTSRKEYDRLKAILHQCVHQGPDSQNRERHVDFRKHLLGRILYAGQWNATRQKKLMFLFDRITWQ